ncbi:MAG TPA: sigma-70 family RNA polymerase sigma factor [Planctomycetota bacterium]|nr:sigma-70 family RNA polymerase sigma factor [Planctomycetota bacterium]
MADRFTKNELDSQAQGRRDLPTTRWSLVVGIQAGTPEARREALGHLFERYKKPIYHYFRLKWKMRPDEAQDLTADFFTMLLEGDALQRYQPGRSSFRTYLKGILKNFTLDQIKKTDAQKRGGDRDREPLNDSLPAAVSDNPDTALDWSWRMTVLERAVEATRVWFLSEKRETQFRTFQSAVLELKEERPTDGQIALQLGISESAVGNHINIVRVKLREMIRGELIQTVLDKEQLDEEYRLIIGKSGL